MKNVVTVLLLTLVSLTFGQQHDGPYLEVSTENAVVPLKESKTDVQISGTIAHVQLTQIYQNNGDIPIEAKYVFPLSKQAAVHKMQMIVDGRVINAKVFEKQEAQQVYDLAINEGKRAAKLDQHRPNVFQMNVGNVMPNDEVTIAIYYTELLVPVNGEYQFVAPGVVGPRFTGESSSSEETFNMPYRANGVSAPFDFDMKVNINAGMIIQNVSSATHQINVNYPDPKTATIFLSKSNENPANRDFILKYNLRGNAIQSGLLLYEHGDENFFAYLMEPANQVKLEDIPSREYLFIVDVSGSMNGYPLEVSKELMRNLLCNLRETDTFNVQLFASSSTVFSPAPVEAYGDHIEDAIRFLSEGQGGGGTELLSALQHAYQLPRKDPGSARSMVIITDGYVTVEKEAFQMIKNNLDQANVFTFGIGSSVNRYLIEGMAKVSNSESFIATTRSEAQVVARDFKDYIATPLLTQVKLKTKDFEIYDVAPASISDVFAARPVVVYGKYKGNPKGKLIVTGYQGKKKFKQEFKVSEGDLDKKNKALRYLWARKKIAELDDYNTLFYEDTKARVVALGLQYNLATNYTSFVAVDERRVNEEGALKTVKQPLMTPKNMNSMAIGAEAEVTGKTKFSKSYKTIITTEVTVSKTEKRQLIMEFKTRYTKLVQKHLAHHSALRIKFNKEGILISVETLQNGQWVLDAEIIKEFSKTVASRFNIRQAMTITLKK